MFEHLMKPVEGCAECERLGRRCEGSWEEGDGDALLKAFIELQETLSGERERLAEWVTHAEQLARPDDVVIHHWVKQERSRLEALKEQQ